MELVCASSSSKKKGKATSDKNPHALFDPKRQKDWTVEETNILLQCVKKFSSENGLVGLNFASTQWSGILKLFKDKIPDTVRTKDKLNNRWKVLRERFMICYELVEKRSGGNWDAEKQRPGAPNEQEYREMVEAKGDKARFLLPNIDPSKGKFIWYEQMLPLVGGRSSRGERSKATWNPEEEYSQQFLPLPAPPQRSGRQSEQGSSDEPQEFPNDTDVSSPPRRSSSHTTYPMSQGSGSKRKSTDESAGEGNSGRKNKGKIYRERYHRKEDQLQKLFDVGLEIAGNIKSDSAQDRDEMDQCITKMHDFGYTCGPEHDYILHEIESFSRRIWFLKATKEMVTNWLNGTKLFGNQSQAPSNQSQAPINQSQAPNNPYGFTAMLARNAGMPTYPNFPNQGGYNYGYQPPPEF